jgi:HSP20 family protein
VGGSKEPIEGCPLARRDAFRVLPLFLPAADAARELDWQPSVDVYRSCNAWLLKFDLAGVRPQDVELALCGNVLTVRGVRRDCVQEEGYCHYRMEIAYSRFERRIEIPGPLDNATIRTEHRDGMLIVRICWEGSV